MQSIFRCCLHLFALLTLTLALSAQTPVDPVAWLKAENNAADATAFGNNGTVTGSVPYVAGKVGNAFSFNGNAANIVRIPNAASLQSPLLTVEYWIYFNNAHNPVNVTKRSAGGAGDAWQAGLVYVAPNFQLQFVGNTAGGLAAWYSGNLASPVGVWTHVAATYDGTTVKGYVNGVQVLSQTAALQLGTQNADIYLGAHPGGSNPLNGGLDEVSIYNRALSAAEVAAIYQAGSAGKGSTAPTVTGVSPNSGPAAGGTSVTITGTNFTGATGVTFGGAAATGVTVVNATTLTATTPAGAAGPVSVVVTTPAGSNAANALYTYGGPNGGQNTAPSFDLPQDLSLPWTARESIRQWIDITSSADGTRLAAVANGGQIYTSADAGGTWTPRESNRAWAAIASSADGMKLAAVVLGGQIYTSADAGVTWTPQESNRQWRAIASSTDGTKLAAAVVNGQIYTSTDAGVTWTARESARSWNSIASSADGSKLAAVAAFPNAGQIYTSADAGVTWTPRPDSRIWRTVASSADGTRLAASVSPGQIYTSVDSGATWTPRDSDRSWRTVISSADGRRLAAVIPVGRIYTSTDSGVTWTPRESIRTWQSITSSADGTRLAAVANGGQIYTSPRYILNVAAGSGPATAAGFATNISPGPAGEAGQTVSFQVSNDNNALFTVQPALSSGGTLTFTPANLFGDATVTVIARDNGGTAGGGVDTSYAQSFTISVTPPPPPTVTAVSPASGPSTGGTSVTITGTNFTGATGVTFGGAAATGVTVVNATTITATVPAGAVGTASVVVSTVGGSSAANSLYTYLNAAPAFALPLTPASPWTPRNGLRRWASITSSADGTRLAAVVNGDADGYIYLSTDAGATWTTRMADATRTWYCIASSADGSKLAAGIEGGLIYTSADSGATWVPRASYGVWMSIASSADGTKLAAVASPGRIYTSTNSGVTWTARESSRSWQAITSSADGTKLAAIAQYGQIYTSTDSGVTWTPRESDRAWYGIASSADGSKLAAVVKNGRIYTSTDSGASWTPRESSRNWYAITSSTDGSSLAAVEFGGSVYTSTDSGLTWTARAGTRYWWTITSSADGTRLAAAEWNGQIHTSPLHNINVVAGSGPYSAAGFATGISPGPAPESGQVVSFQLSGSNSALFTVPPAISANGTLTFTPGTATGLATFTVTAKDDGGTAGGGVDTSQPQAFTITILPPPIEAWRQTHFGFSANTGNAADGFDFDGDGVPNLAEYGLVLDPKTLSPGPAVDRGSYPGGDRLRMILARDPARFDASIEVQAGSDLTGWTTIATSALGAPFTGPGYVAGDSAAPGVKTVEIRDVVSIAGQSRRFLRVRVTR